MSNASTQSKTPLAFPIAFGALVMGAIGMGISPVFVRLAEVGPFASAFWRVCLALPFLWIWAVSEARRNGSSTQHLRRFDRTIVLAGLFFAGDLFFWHLAIMKTSIANATLMACLAPLWVLLLSGTILGEKVEKTAFIGLALCLSGAAMLIGASYAFEPDQLIGDLYGVITSVFFGLYILAIRMGRRKDEAGALTLKSTVITTIALGLVAVALEPTLWPASASGLLALIALGLISQTGGQGLMSVALGSLSAPFSALVIFIEALAAAILGWLVFNETLSPWQFAGGGLILWGIWMARPRGE